MSDVDRQFADLQARIAAAVSEAKEGAAAGLWESGLRVMRLAQHRLTASVVTGNLRASGYVRTGKRLQAPGGVGDNAKENKPVPADSMPPLAVEIGFTANYALYVHEDIEGGRSPKFLEAPILENRDKIVEIIASYAGVDEEKNV